jgi:antitoxin (DNA-binding transcriptional repressor) of toxin-antitoxin stability system
MSITIDVLELSSRLGEALAIVSSGQEVLLCDGAIPCVRLVPCEGPAPRIPGLHDRTSSQLPATSLAPRVPGLHKVAIEVAADFDAPLPDDFWTCEQ